MRTKRNTSKTPAKLASVADTASALTEYWNKESRKTQRELVPSGCVLFNLACSGRTSGFMEFGTMANIVGDSDAGKTFLAMTILATCFYKYGDAYQYDYYDYERAVSFNIAALFGKAFADALNYYPMPEGKKATIEFWYKRQQERLSDGKPHIVITDSFDAMTSIADLKALIELAKQLKKEGKTDKSALPSAGFGIDKPRKASKYFPLVCQMLADTGSVMVIISQTRENLNPFSFDKKTRSGGKALRFYSSLEVWLAKLNKLGADKKRPIGGVTRALVKRSRVTGKVRQCEFPILYAYGLDDTRASIMFLADEGVVSCTNKVYTIKKLGVSGKMKACVAEIENDPTKIVALRKLVKQTWKQIEDSILEEVLGCGRKPKFPA